MLFATHLLVAWVIGRLSRLSALWLVVGGALPDALDKPLAAAGVVATYHSVGHSVLALAVVVPVALYDRRALALVAGAASHHFLDAVHITLNGRPGNVLFLAWPLTTPTDPLGIPPGRFFVHYLGTPSFFLETALWGSVLALTAAQRLPSTDS